MSMPKQHSEAGRVYNVPLACNKRFMFTGTPGGGFEPHDVTENRKRDIRSSRDYTVGPVPVEEFLDAFLPAMPLERKQEVLSSRGAFKAVPSSGATPPDIYEPLIAALNAYTKRKCRAPGFVFENASAHSPHPHKPGYMKPHICCYASHNAELVRRSDISSRAELGHAELFIEVKPDISMDYFVDPPLSASDDERSTHEFISQPTDSDLLARVDRAFGQHISYATEIFARQERIFLFSISLSGSCARLFRWDRSGVIVTRSFDMRERPDLLCEFLGRFACASDAQRGHDCTVEMATAEEEVLFRGTIAQCVKMQLDVVGDDLAKAVSEHYRPGHVVAMHVFGTREGTSAAQVDRYLVSRPVASPLYLTGHGTRGYWAVHASTRRLVFLKDTWRLPDSPLEGTIIAGLNAAGVRYVPSLVSHGDVYVEVPSSSSEVSLRRQISATYRYNTLPWACRVHGKRVSVSTHIHYRLVLGVVGHGLTTFEGSDELLHATYDVFHAMRDALEKDSRIHRDISLGNIILVRERAGERRRGYLIDWETSSRVDEEGHSLDSERTGTWKFMSFKVLFYPEQPHVFQDDMESLFYVVLYCSLRHLPNSLSADELGSFMHEFFDQSAFCFGALRGGTGKGANAGSRFWTRRVSFKNTDLQTWLDTVMDYNGPPLERKKELKEYWSNPDFLDAFWGAFLREHSLPCGDRADNPLIEPHRFKDHTDPSIVPLRRPKAQVDALKQLTRPKPRSLKRSLSGPINPPTPRRSERFRRDKAKPLAQVVQTFCRPATKRAKLA
ncbi:hypothetical protein BV20DRAFT_1055249 [Pilatotrama ljubarskyi]|nr:hypothetical protein BV20DRAFT_1055249 [Pilatotrama ljubarskyi]